MHSRYVQGLIVFALALCAGPAWAFLDPPYLTPANPISGELVSVNIYGGECDVADDGVIWPPPGYAARELHRHTFHRNP